MNEQTLKATAAALTADARGLLAMDESNPTANKRFAALGIAQTPEMRRAYRDLIVTAPGLAESITGRPTRTRSRATPRCARRPTSCPSSSPRC
jgi:fructose-bisphosphate aldolase class I